MGSVSFRRAFLESREKNYGEDRSETAAVSAVPVEKVTTDNTLDYIKELFFHSKIRGNLDWPGLCLEKQHDFKFWANVTHSLGMFILKSIFNADIPFEDSREVRRMTLMSSRDIGLMGHERRTSNYVNELQIRVSFVLLSGMLANRIPGSLRLIARSHGYQYFEHRITTLLNDFPNIDAPALCFNINALRTLLPFLQETASVNLSAVCQGLLTSKFWKIMWLDIGVCLKRQNDTEKSLLFSTFLELASEICYGTRSQSLFKRLYTSSPNSLWDPIFLVLSWKIEPKVLCRLVTFVADLLLISLQDGCFDLIGQDCLSKLMQCVVNTESEGRTYLETYATQTLDQRNEFYHHYALIAVDMLHNLDLVLQGASDKLSSENVRQLYEISSLGTAKMTLPPVPGNNEDSSVKFDYSETRTFPRVLPCFNGECRQLFHLDMPQLHVHDADPQFAYCKRCGIPSYCSSSCANTHWESSHRDVCGFFRVPPTFARFVSPMTVNGSPILQTLDNSSAMTPFFDDDGNVVTLY
ncbi:uncharacterized protein BXIN_0366 [Babesia sp. Xinjiang]|uniref:uncharacterized protein n=1 Tax=Babesia sp. Xinjiang TaxID=462227 RepID=UPI000A217A93|nr:uncharacterized protein BXIN_0366 [Babesia sp. Xinjiang]ORM41181.1 hypothetical protein BXIN_0366 [Babesia sp. Xinjiang]